MQSVDIRIAPRTSADVATEDQDYVAAIVGAPRWITSELATVAARNGHGAALIAAWRQNGVGLFDSLRGPFALVLVDKQRAQSLLAVDRFGIERLCYGTSTTGALKFGPSAIDVAAACGRSRQLCADAIYHYLFYHMIPSPLTVFDGVKKLEPGHYVLTTSATTRVERYFHPRYIAGEAVNRSVLEHTLLVQLRAAVSRTVEDVPVGAFLSGGLDSSTVVGLLSEHSRPAHSYSIGFSEERYNELEYARVVARHFGTVHHERLVTPDDVADAIPLIAAAYDEPFGNSSAVPAYYCAEFAAADGIRTLLAGDGGDELFAGNSRYVQQLKLEAYQKLPEVLRRRFLEPLLGDSTWPGQVPLVRKAASYVKQARVPLPDRLESWNHLVRTGPQSILHPEFAATIDATAPLALLRRVYARSSATATVDRMLELDWQQTLADNDLRKVMRTCELAGVNVRFPLLDDELAAFSMRVPATFKIRGLRLRDFYRRACDGFLPDAVLRKRKHGFALPFGIWMAEHDRLRAIGAASLGALRQRNVIRNEYLDELVSRHGSEHAAYFGEFIWVLVMLEQWLTSHDL